MGKYEPLARYLKSLPDNSWNATFAQIEEKLGFALPRSARDHRAWWSNQRNGNHSQTAGWQLAGWETRDVDLKRGIVRFERTQNPPSPARNRAPTSRPALIAQASGLSGIKDPDELIDAALAAFIQREAGRRLVALGGTMPDAEAAPRERPFA